METFVLSQTIHRSLGGRSVAEQPARLQHFVAMYCVLRNTKRYFCELGREGRVDLVGGIDSV